MGIITRSLPSTYLEEIRDPARETNLHALWTLTYDGLSHFPPRAIAFLCNSAHGKISSQAEKCRVTSI